MRTATLRQSGGSVILSIPKAFLDQLGLTADATVDIDLVDGKIVIARPGPGRIGLQARLAMCDFTQPLSADEHAWLDSPLVGGELI